ncbi:hypothetical protein GXM_00495 [Nostoc sphaeroides CCNUC1]|uniref:Uncharacterized protein n=1 Tax=Nostoc sphaeroides CCNUC1 TaxID=2653204 RepID=A0A5P8VRG8_9NOSO|nr:hypothetical protein GXM_00495 [Nostoc sphaeroides CCNUC1]
MIAVAKCFFVNCVCAMPAAGYAYAATQIFGQLDYNTYI